MCQCVLLLVPKSSVALHKVELTLIQLISLHFNTSQYNEHKRMDEQILGATSHRRINFVGWRLISVGPDH